MPEFVTIVRRFNAFSSSFAECQKAIQTIPAKIAIIEGSVKRVIKQIPSRIGTMLRDGNRFACIFSVLSKEILLS